MIDWFAVDVVCSGTKMRLTPSERRAVVRRLSDKLVTPEDHYTGGKLTSAQLAHRLGCTPRTVERIKDELPEATRGQCPVCGGDMWVWRNNIVEPHPDALLQQCPMSNTSVDDAGWEQKIAFDVVWLAQRLRAGDANGVWEAISVLPDRERRRLLVAALAAVPVEVEDPFAWLAGVAA